MGELHISFVCTGNICRSPMAEKILATYLSRAGLTDRVRVSSAGTYGWHTGSDADPRTTETLRRAGYGIGHRAAEFGPEHASADLVVAMTAEHDRTLAGRGVPQRRRRLLRSFDPDADGTEVPDPYYGADTEFELVRAQIEAAVPGLLDWVRDALADRTATTGGPV